MVHKFQLKSIGVGGLTVRVRICVVAFLSMVSSGMLRNGQITEDSFSLARIRYLGSAMINGSFQICDPVRPNCSLH